MTNQTMYDVRINDKMTNSFLKALQSLAITCGFQWINVQRVSQIFWFHNIAQKSSTSKIKAEDRMFNYEMKALINA